MKTLKICLVTTLSLLCLNLWAQQGLDKALLGSWALDLDATLKSADNLPRYGSLPENKKASVRNAFQGRTFHLLGNGKAVITYGAKDPRRRSPGNWSYDAALEKLTITADGNSKTFRVERKEDRRIRLVFDKTSPQALFHSLILVRKN